MPGILPMKVIKIGSNAQTRIAQACDRCRSKKIRCDGIRPCCTQCANVGFECKTSDKLSRRAFPRGYTESLEERVRALEAEVRELKDLLDEKDEKIDMLSRIHSHSPQSFMHTSPRRASNDSAGSDHDVSAVFDESDEYFQVHASRSLVGRGPGSYFAGNSTAHSFIESFLKQAAAGDHTIGNFDSSRLTDIGHKRRASDSSSKSYGAVCWTTPPRLLSDQLINIFFQEWAPLFPVLHRPTFLKTYETYVANTDAVLGNAELAHLNLVFAIAAYSTGTGAEELNSFDGQWEAALDLISDDCTVDNLQAMVLAQMLCLQRHDTSRLLTYRKTSVTLSSRLSLHQNHKTGTYNPLITEVRKRLFWTLYTVDAFSSLVLGLPTQVKDKDVVCEYPVDSDDEYITEHGFQPILPGESTKISAALALFKAVRILSRVLDQLFLAKASYDLSLKHLSDLTDELELWEASLPSHLRLQFAQDKPSTGTITSRSPILSLVYHYVRALIQRPAISAGLGNKASSVLLVHASSCKRMVQILELLDERGLAFSLCLNKDETLVLCGIGSLQQRIKLDSASKIRKDNRNVITTVYRQLLRSESPTASSFGELAKAFVPDLESNKPEQPAPKTKNKPSISRCSSDQAVSSKSDDLQTSTKRQLKALASRFTSTASMKIPTLATASNGRAIEALNLSPQSSTSRDIPALTPLAHTSPSLSGSTSDASLSPLFPHSRPLSMATNVSSISASLPPASLTTTKRHTLPAITNLDYLSFGTEPGLDELTAVGAYVSPVKTEPQPTDWEKLLGDLDNGTTNIFDASYGGRAIEALLEASPMRQHQQTTAVSDAALAWNAGMLTLRDLAKSKKKVRCGVSAPTRSSHSIRSTSSDEGRGSIDNPFGTGWTSASSINDAPDAFTQLDLADLALPFNFETDVGLDWQENLTSAGV